MTAERKAAVRNEASAERGPDLSGRWRSQCGSEMVLHVSEDGHVKGSYRSAVGSVDPLSEFPLVGWASGDLLSFTVSFGGRGIAAWVGQHAGATAEGHITALWHLAEDIPEDLEPGWLWYGVKTGADTFSRVR